ncbi:AGR246Wp [Eremothecium gossypii ATCC 10895]|uniref:AGR246Wp n=1 Tax=Eremothecium gossypii (strain ATCC 10895 / CBS 109.51 / FGSC 9923 / NRRL Y-1056) TaxID=284811 RepID=Q74ZF3_EREGS|nr:AGR246Wp [Eremothecium gossypii ATCC 10895]AAS54736.1 AGR246Wp [Eremothecium gossypii ATCC 10895]AEY99067.1 FAGR246Wp [Eremothecium gossypii FDAG1]
MPFYFAIIGHKDNPIYEVEFISLQQSFPPDLKELNPFILHASLDIIEDLQWQSTHSASLASSVGNSGSSGGGSFLRSRHTHGGAGAPGSCYLSKVDNFYGLSITGYITYGNMKFVMIHGTQNGAPVSVDDGMLKSFYQEVHELYIKTLMNPFYKVDEPITSPTFDWKVKQLAKKYLVK